jgi:hypothetical protein
MEIIKPFPGKHLHGISLGEWYPCWNLALSGRIASPDFLAFCEPELAASHQSIRDISIKCLRTESIFMGVSSPRTARYVWAAAIIRRGGHVGIGSIDTKWLDQEEMGRIVAIGDMELEFERVRREIAQNAASRLSCLWVAEDTEEGKTHIRSMLGSDILILKVRIPVALRVSKVDTTWLDAYFEEPRQEFIENYWRSIPFNEQRVTWEYLVDGAIEVNDPEGMECIRRYGAHLHLTPGTIFSS